MKLTRNTRAISRLLLILLLLTASIIGAVLSYLWVIGAVINLGIRVPKKPTLSITNATFNPQNTTFFDVTLLNPSYSPSEANILQIATSYKDVFLYNVPPNETYPQLPYKLPKAEEETFRCFWNWANYTGQSVKIIAFIEDGSGPTFEANTPLVDLHVHARFNSTISVTHFNMTVENLPASVTYVNIKDVAINREIIPHENLRGISLPYLLNPDESVSFACMWNWTNYQNKDVTVAVYTLQGYVAYHTYLTPKPVMLNITKVLFNVTDTFHFNVTVQNSKDSPTYVNITRITVTVENETFPDVPVVPPPDLPYSLDLGANVTFMCSWNWTNYREKTVTITVHTLQNFTASSTQATTERVILIITEIFFDVTDPYYFNITVRNSEFSVEEYVNITRVTVAVENGTPINIFIDPYKTLYANASVTLKCVWNWTDYWNEEVSITVYTLQGYSAYSIEVTPSPVMISDVVFNLSDTAHFNVTVENSEFFSTYVLITSITVTLENGTVQDVTVIAPTRLPYVLHYNESVVFMCSWSWTEYCDRNVTVTVNTLQGYMAYYTKATPEPVTLIITSVFFNTANTTYFNINVTNFEYSLMQVNITRISVTLQNGTSWNVTVEPPPSLPYTLYPDETVKFKCLWDWYDYRGQIVIIKVETLEGYEVSGAYEVPMP